MRPRVFFTTLEETSAADPRLKYCVQMTNRDAVGFRRKSDAEKWLAGFARGLKAEGWTVSGKSDAKICYRGEESLSILLTARTKR